MYTGNKGNLFLLSASYTSYITESLEKSSVLKALNVSVFPACQLAGAAAEDSDLEDRNVPFRQLPFCKYKGHTADLLDLSWSKVRVCLLDM